MRPHGGAGLSAIFGLTFQLGTHLSPKRMYESGPTRKEETLGITARICVRNRASHKFGRIQHACLMAAELWVNEQENALRTVSLKMILHTFFDIRTFYFDIIVSSVHTLL